MTRLSLAALGLATAATLAGCGGGSDSAPVVPPVEVAPTTATSADVFTKAVDPIAGKQQSEDTEPSDVTALTLTAPETAEPDPLS